MNAASRRGAPKLHEELVATVRCTAEIATCGVENLSMSGAQLIGPLTLETGARVHLSLATRGLRPLALDADVVSTAKHGRFQTFSVVFKAPADPLQRAIQVFMLQALSSARALE